jgi:hypothetical protein
LIIATVYGKHSNALARDIQLIGEQLNLDWACISGTLFQQMQSACRSKSSLLRFLEKKLTHSTQHCGFSSQVLYPPALGAVKLSIILFLLRVLPIFHTWIIPLYYFAAWVTTEEVTFTVGLFFQCRPINYYWGKTGQGSCFNQPAFSYADASCNMATDICLLSLLWIIFRSMVFPSSEPGVC